MRVTAICNLKGGVGKSTTAINLAAILARDYHKRVLLIDADSQCNTTEFFCGDSALGNIAQLLRDAGQYSNPGVWAADLIQITAYSRLDLLAAEESLMDLDLSKAESGTVSTDILRQLAENIRNSYDVVLIDCPAAFNAASAAALIAADDVVIPIKLDAFALRGMGNLMRQIANMQKLNPKLRVAGVLPTMWYSAPLVTQGEQQLRDAGLAVYPHIRQSRPVDRMTYAQQPLCVSSPRSAAGKDYRQFAAKYMEEGAAYGL